MKKAPLLEYFIIYGLHGYKNVTVKFENPCLILIAENGSGKTTILQAINFVLTGKLNKLIA